MNKTYDINGVGSTQMSTYIPDSLQAFTDYFAKHTMNQEKGGKYHAVMLFYTEGDIIGSGDFNKWINTRNVYFTDGVAALNYYANTPCPASQLVTGESIEELLQEMNQMIKNYQDEEFLKKLYETL